MKSLVFMMEGRPVTDSLTVAEVFDKEHKRVLQDIRELGCSDEFGQHNFVLISYRDSMNRERPKYILTEQGFALLVMGYTGHQAMEFKEKYIAEFERMRNNKPADVVPMDDRKVRIELLKTAIDHEERLDGIEQKIALVEAKVEEQITLDSGEQRRLQKAVSKRIYELEQETLKRPQLYSQLYREIKDRWAVPSYKDVRRTEFSEVLNYVSVWKPRIA